MNRLLRILTLLALLGLPFSTLQAAVVTWDGGAAGTTKYLNDPLNWTGDVLPGTVDIASISDAGVATIEGTHDYPTSLLGLVVGGAGTRGGAIIQSGGTVTVTSAGQAIWTTEFIGKDTYGYYKMSGGTLNLSTSNVAYTTIGYNAPGVFEQTGGNVLQTNQAGAGDYLFVGMQNQNGILDVSGTGNFTTHTRVPGYSDGIMLGYKGGTGVLNIRGSGSVNINSRDLNSTSLNGGTLMLGFDYGGMNGGSAIVNLGGVGTGGGTLQVGRINSSGTGGTRLFNFHGGTLISKQPETDFWTNDSNVKAFVYSEGAIIETTGWNTNINQPLLNPTGYGLTNAVFTGLTGGSGYFGTPIVKISGGAGSGATANAVVTNGQVTGFVLTNPGTGYQPDDVLTVEITGGGATTTATVNADTSASNLINFDLTATPKGGLTKRGPGTLFLNNSSTYLGATTVEGGTLFINGITLASSSIVVKTGAALAGVPDAFTTALPRTTVETGGLIDLATPGPALVLGGLNLKNGAALKVAFTETGAFQPLVVTGDITHAGGLPVNVEIGYTGTFIGSQAVLSIDPYSSGVFDSATTFTFSLPGGKPVLDSDDGRMTPVTVEKDTPNRTVWLVAGGPIDDPAWNKVEGGDWTESTYWGPPNTVPNSGNARAMFTGTLGSGTIPINLNTSPQLSSMIFESKSGESYDIASVTNHILLNSEVAQNWHISVFSGSHTVDAAIQIAKGSGQSAIRLADSSHLTLSGIVSDATAGAGINLEGNFNGTISGTAGTGILTLSGANIYTGPTTVKNAVLEIPTIVNHGVASTLGASDESPTNLVLNNGTLHYTDTAAASTDRGMTLAGANVNLQLDGDVSISGNLVTPVGEYPTVQKTGAGILTLNDTAARTNYFGYDNVLSQGGIDFAGGASTIYSMDGLSLGVAGGNATIVNQTSGTVAYGSYLEIGRFTAATYSIAAGKIDLSNSGRLYAGTGDATGGFGNGILNVGGTAEIVSQGFNIGWNGNAGIVNLSGGSILLASGDNAPTDWSSTIGRSAFGCVNVGGGLLKFNNSGGQGNVYIGAMGNSAGILNQSEGTVEVADQCNFYVGGSGAGRIGDGLMNITGGSFKMSAEAAGAGDGWGLILGYQGSGVLNVSGSGTVNLQGTTTAAKSFLFVGFVAPTESAIGGTGIVNLGKVNAGSGGGGGTITNAAFIKGVSGTSTFNFHGGTLEAAEAVIPTLWSLGVAGSFMDNFTHTYIYPEGAKVSVAAGHSSMFAQVFEDPTGNGLSNASITMSNLGSGYIGTPLVTITGGGTSAQGATANAVVNSAGQVTGIVITNPGIGYTEAPTITITGGGGVDAAVTVDPLQFVANTGGAFEKLGDGTLIMTAACTYTGPTKVSGGTLSVDTILDGGLASPIGASSSASANLVLAGGGKLLYTGAAASTNRGLTLGSGGGKIESANDLTFSGSVVGASGGGLTKGGASMLTLTGPVGYAGPTVIGTGKLSINNSTTSSIGNVTGAGSLAVTGTGTVLTTTSIRVGTLSPSSAASAVPEPGTFVLLTLAGLGVIGMALRKR